MKKTLVSLATASLIASTAMAADKGIDIVTTGQTVLYYETHADDGKADSSHFNQDQSAANVGVQLNLGSDLGNNFTFGSQLSYIGTAGLEKNLVSGVKQVGGQSQVGAHNTTDELALTKIFVAKKIGNTNVKIGRQELPKSLSPLAFSEGWNVFKNTFEAILVVNSDIPDTTLVGAYVAKSNSTTGLFGHAGLSTMTDTTVNVAGVGAGSTVNDGAYMITAQNKSIPMTTLTGSFYSMSGITGATQADATAIWIDAKIASKDLPMGLVVGLQGGTITPDVKGLKTDDTTAMGIKVGMKPIKPVYLQLAYSNVNDGHVAVKNVGTGIKTPLFTQMIYNQNAIARDNSTIVAKAVYNTGDYGKIIAQYGMTTAGDTNSINGENDYTELDVIYRIKSGGVAYWASVMMINADVNGAKSSIIGAAADAESDTKIRLWGRYAF